MAALQMFVVESRSNDSGVAFRLCPALGVMALAISSTESTSMMLRVGALANEALGYIDLGLTDSIRNAPGLQKYEHPARDAFTPGRLIGSLQLANERFRQQHADLTPLARTSLAAAHVADGRATIVCVGAGLEVWTASGRGATPLVRAQDEPELASPLNGASIGRSEGIEPVVVHARLASNDLLLLLGSSDVGLVSIFSREANLDQALALAMTSTAGRPGLPVLVGRWTE